MHEWGLFLGVVTFVAPILGVTPRTDGMNLLLRFGDTHRFLQIVAGVTVLFSMTINTAEGEQFGVLLVEKCHHRQRIIIGEINLLLRFRDLGVRYSDNVSAVAVALREVGPLHRHVADFAVGIMAPFTVAGNALPMVGSLKTRLTEIGRIGFAAVTLRARRDFSGRTVMVAGATAVSHSGHFRMQFMIEVDGAVLIDQPVEDQKVGSLGVLMLLDIMGDKEPWAGFEARIIGGRIDAEMAFGAVYFGQSPMPGFLLAEKRTGRQKQDSNHSE